MSRFLKDSFLEDLNDQNGILNPILAKVKTDDTLMLALRDAAIDIYYRGGRILHLEEIAAHGYIAEFDWSYAKVEATKSELESVLPKKITEAGHAEQWKNGFKYLREMMDFHFATSAKSEREFQQLVVWENNRSKIAGGTEYFITDIEFAVSKCRVDMLGVKWLASDRKRALNCKPVLIEMKYGDDALDGKAGIVKHIGDFAQIIATEGNRLSTMIAKQFEQLTRLGMLKYNESKGLTSLTMGTRPEIVFILANHTPRGEKLQKILKKVSESLKTIQNRDAFDLRFFVASSAGYALHDSCMLDLTRYQALVSSKLLKAE